MTERIAYLCGALPKVRIFADIGCDHGYCTQYMLRNHLCERAYISDISAKSLKKAEALLSGEIAAGRCIPVVADGLDGLPEPCDFVLIAGMGGEEILSILDRHPLPARFLLQPMKNSEKLRAYLLSRGAAIERDETFSEGRQQKKYYDLILGAAQGGGEQYTALQLRYGRDNLGPFPPPAFLSMLREEMQKLKERMLVPTMKEGNRARLMDQYREMEDILHAYEGRL